MFSRITSQFKNMFNLENSNNNTIADNIVAETVNQYISLSPDYDNLMKQIKKQERLLELLPESNKQERLEVSQDLNALREQEKQFRTEVFRLYEAFTKIEMNTERLQKAKEYFEHGRFREADAILKAEELTHDQQELLALKNQKEQELQNITENLQRNANEFLIKARLTVIRFDMPNRIKETAKFFEQSLESFRSPDVLLEYALFMQQHRQLAKDIDLYEELMEIYERLAKDHPAAYEPAVAMTLNNLANLHSDVHDYASAKQEYRRVIAIMERLAQENPAAYEPYFAMILNNLATLHNEVHDYVSAEQEYQRALAIYERLAQENPAAYEPAVATTLNNLGNLHRDVHDYVAQYKHW